MKKSIALAGLCAFAALNFSAVAQASGSISTCIEPNCGGASDSDNRRYAKSLVTYKRTDAGRRNASMAKTLAGESLGGSLAGEWDAVAGVVSFPWQTAEGLDLYLVALSLPTQSTGNEQYSASGWQRELFFMDFGDGVPRLLSSYLLDPDFTPQAGDVLEQSGQLWTSQYVLYQEAEELAGDADFYAGYADGAAVADLRFVANEAGEVLQVAVDIYDDAGTYQYSVAPRIGDRLNPSFIGYDLQQPDILYALYYFDEPRAITEAISLERSYYVPNASSDSSLPEGFNSTDLELAFILEGAKTVDDESSFAYSAPQGLGYTWGKAQQDSATGGGSSGSMAPWLLMLLGGIAARSRRNRLRGAG